jgi:zinc transport system substrate-binding protein
MGFVHNARGEILKMKNEYRIPRMLLFLFLTLSIMLSACQPIDQETAPQQETFTVTVSILPLAYFVERIAGDKVAVNVMVGPGEEAHTYEPKPEQMKSLTDSRIFFAIGVEYETVWLSRFEDINPDLMIVDSAKGIERIPLATDHAHQGKEEDQDGLDPHVWLSPDNGQMIAKNILTALDERLPEQGEIFQKNYETLMTDIKELDTGIQSALNGLTGRKFMVFHPAWGYFANQYNLEEISVQVGGQNPSASELASIIDIAQQENIKVIFIQPTFNTAFAEAIAQEINAEVAVVDPLARDWLPNLEKAAEAFASAIDQQ